MDERPWFGHWAIPFAAAIVAAILGVTLSGYWAMLGISAVTTALLALSVGLLFNRAGMLALCPLSFAALGAWMAGWFNLHRPLPFVLVMVAAGVASVPVGAIIGALAIRLRGMNLAIATLAIASVTQVILTVFPIPGVNQGRPVHRPGFAASQSGYFLFCLATLVVIGVVITLVMRGRLGATWIMLKSERATAGAGTNVLVAKLSVFVVSCAIAAIAGVLMIGQTGILDPVSFGIGPSLLIVVIAILVGAGRMEGAVVGGIIGTLLPELLLRLNIPSDIATIFFGLAALQILRGGDQGAAGQQQAGRAARRVKRAFRRAEQRATGGAVPAGDLPTLETTAEAPPPPPASKAAAPDGSRRSPAPVADGAGPALEISGLGVRFGAVSALDDVSLVVPAHAVVGLIGPNGAGKTTLLDAASGFVQVAAGSVKLHGRPLGRLAPDHRARAGLRRTFQQVRVADDLTVEGYLSFAARRHLTRDELEELLSLFACPAPDRSIGTLDVPTRRQVELAAAIAARPSVLMLDEPAAGLGEAESAALAERLRQVPDRFDISILLVEHDIDVVLTSCSKVTVLDYGRMLASGAPHEVVATEEVRRAYLGMDGDA